jgi:hypothetical protein
MARFLGPTSTSTPRSSTAVRTRLRARRIPDGFASPSAERDVTALPFRLKLAVVLPALGARSVVSGRSLVVLRRPTGGRVFGDVRLYFNEPTAA